MYTPHELSSPSAAANVVNSYHHGQHDPVEPEGRGIDCPVLRDIQTAVLHRRRSDEFHTPETLRSAAHCLESSVAHQDGRPGYGLLQRYRSCRERVRDNGLRLCSIPKHLPFARMLAEMLLRVQPRPVRQQHAIRASHGLQAETLCSLRPAGVPPRGSAPRAHRAADDPKSAGRGSCD